MFKSSEIEFFKENFFVKENIESSEIFHLSNEISKSIHYSTNTCQSCQATMIFISETNIIVNSFEASNNQVSQYYKLELL
jgi:hypothetical protein